MERGGEAPQRTFAGPSWNPGTTPLPARTFGGYGAPVVRRRWSFLLLVLLATVGSAQAPTGSAQDPAELAARARRILERRDAQTELPGGRGGGGSDRPAGRQQPRGSGQGRDTTPDRGSGVPLRALIGAGSLATPLLWGAVALAAAILIAAIVRSFGGRRTGPGRVAERRIAVDRLAADEPAPQALPDHAVHAARGDFAAAVQALLQHSLVALQARAGSLPIHATARAAVRIARSRQLAAEPFAGLVRLAERVHFGGQPAGRDDYEAALRGYEQWRAACRTTN